jgi:hypothetical protein
MGEMSHNRHCERREQSISRLGEQKIGLLRRFAPRNDGDGSGSGE